MVHNFYIKLIFISIGVISSTLADDTGLKYYKKQNFEEAKAYYERILAERKTDAAASLGLG